MRNTGPGMDEDAMLMRRLADGDDLALNALMTRWKDKVAAFLFGMVGDDSTATDLAQETFLRLYTSRNSYKPSAAFPTFLFCIAANLARTHMRWKRRHSTVPLANEHGELIHEPADARPPPDEAAALAEAAGFVMQAVTGLHHDLREALLLCAVEQMSHAEIAAILGCSAKAVEVRVYRARQALREQFANMPL